MTNTQYAMWQGLDEQGLAAARRADMGFAPTYRQPGWDWDIGLRRPLETATIQPDPRNGPCTVPGCEACGEAQFRAVTSCLMGPKA